ncbi:MAG: sulfurtransferase TusA family protein [Candidatus Rokubacteria bacterium]|nr:sulfurtransferase TusA family protein [Candidatus Rokubacteria bacterium]
MHKRIDCIGLFCPLPVLKARDAMREILPGQALEVTSDDPASEADMRRWSARTGHEILECERHGPIFRFVLRKTR